MSSAQSSSGAAEALGTEHKQARALSGAPVQCFGEVCVCAHGRARERVFAHVGERKRERGRTRSTQHSTAADIFLVIYEIFIFFCSYFFFFRFACFFHRHHKSAEEPPPHLTCFSKSIMQVWRICWGLYVVVIISWVGSLPDPTSCCIIIADRSTGNLLERGNCWTGCRAN